MALIDALLLDPYPFNVWIAYRTDGVKGSGTHADPYNASTKVATAIPVSSLGPTLTQIQADIATVDLREAVVTTPANHGLSNGDLIMISGVTGRAAAQWNGTFAIYGASGNQFKYQMPVPPIAGTTANDTITAAKVINLPFDGLMNSLPANSRVHLGPTVAGKPFLTRGYADGVSGGWQPKPGMKIIGSGIDVTVLQLAGCATADKHYFAIGHALTAGTPPAPNPVDQFEVSELTIDCNLHGQPVASGKTYAPVACGAIRLMGSHGKIHRVKAVNWGAKWFVTTLADKPAFVFSLIAATADPVLLETVNSGLEECLAIDPSQNMTHPTTALHVGGVEANGVQGYGKSPYIRNCFVDGQFRALNPGHPEPPVVLPFYEYFPGLIVTSDTGTAATAGTFVGKRPHFRTKGEYARFRNSNLADSKWNGYFPITALDGTNPAKKFTADLSASSGSDTANNTLITCGGEIRAVSMSSCRGGVVEGNQIHNVWVGGPYVDGLTTKDIVVRNNHYKNVATGPYWSQGSLGSVANVSLSAANTLDKKVTATTSFKHNLFAKAWIYVQGTANYNGFRQITNFTDTTFDFSYDGASSGSSGTYQVVMGVDKLVVEGNVIELADLDATEFAAPNLSGTPAWSPLAILLSDGNISNPPSPYVFGDVVIRNNKIRYIDGRTDVSPNGQPFSGTAIQVARAQNALVFNNVVEATPSDSIKTFRSSSVKCFNNKTPSGSLIQGVNMDTGRKFLELETESEFALILSLFNRKIG